MSRKSSTEKNSSSDTLKSTLRSLESALKDWEAVVDSAPDTKAAKRANDAALRTKKLLVHLKNQIDELS